MAGGSLPLAFGALLAAAVAADYGFKHFGAAWSGGSSSTPAGTGTGSSTTMGYVSSGSGALPASNSGAFTKSQQSFLQRLVADTGLAPSVVASWMANEQPPGSASAPNGANNWLNVGSFDSGFVGGGANVWNAPTTAADATAAFLRGQSVNGVAPPLGGGSPSIRSILSTAGKSPEVQAQAIQNSNWAASHYGYSGIVDLLPHYS